MRTNIVLNEQLIEEVIDLYGFKSKKKAVEEGLKTLLY
ncbi:MAG: type II toxin-antitoxin system VapB family antitoxin, partial [Candidatus Marinimicrobia bacterium]|nr:type II toxin-antitoxin system VapB family antitoxin [Candidatus Neomarinimicrobiota bacterium]